MNKERSLCSFFNVIDFKLLERFSIKVDPIYPWKNIWKLTWVANRIQDGLDSFWNSVGGS